MHGIRISSGDLGTSLIALNFTDQSGRQAAVACIDRSPSDDALLLTPVRVMSNDWRMALSTQMIDSAARQTVNLHNKIAALDRLHLAPTEFSKAFAACRVFAFGDIIEEELEGWAFCKKVLELLSNVTNRGVVAQVDYDQRRLHPTMGDTLDSIDFATKHEPSAVATTTCFQAALQYARPLSGPYAWAVKGAGQLGGRIIKGVASDSRHTFVAERIPDRQLKVSLLSRVSLVSSDDFERSPAEAMVFAADSGSLNSRTARAIAANEYVTVVGGPEAGLDHCVEAIQTLANSRKIFMPSVLCGSLGLVSNLEEALGHSIDLPSQVKQLRSVVEKMAAYASKESTPFHEACAQVLRGT